MEVDVGNDSKTVQVQAAYALQMAAIVIRDLVGSMPPTVWRTMPQDLRRRVQDHFYQEAFNALPEDIRVEAEALVSADPDVIAAREIHGRDVEWVVKS